MLTDIEIAKLCQASYKDVKSPYPSLTLTVNDIEADIYYVGDECVVAFRGTEPVRFWLALYGLLFMSMPNNFKFFWGRLSNLLDVVRDLRFFPWPTKNGYGHAGFTRGAKKWLEEFETFLPFEPFYLTGHSMGAGIAAALANMLDTKDLKRVVLFAEPKGFSSYTKKRYNVNGKRNITVSYLNHNDWIKHLPPWGFRSVEPTILGSGGHSIKDYVTNLTVKESGYDKGSRR